MANIKIALKAKQDTILNKLVRYEEGVMSRRDWINLQRIKGAIVVESTKNRIDFNRIKFNRMNSYKEQEEYERKCNEKVICYELKFPNQNTYWEITKTEYDYFQSMQLAEDVNTEKYELRNRIDAGIATEIEIEEDMQKDIDFINKYFN